VGGGPMPGRPVADQIKVFVSYSRRDLVAADRIVAALEERNIHVTIDRRDLPFGEEWQRELEDFIRAADTVVCLVSPTFIRSKSCAWELSLVRSLNKRLVPVTLIPVPVDELPEAIARIHLLPAEGAFSLDQHADALADTLKTNREWIKEHTRLSDRARQWILRGRPSALLLRGTALTDAERWQDARPHSAPYPSEETLELMLASRRAATTRQRLTVAVSLAAALVATALAGAAAWQWQRAEATYAAARGTVNDLINEIAIGMQSVEGMSVATINRSLEVVEKLIRDLQDKSGGDPLLEGVRGTLFYQFAKTYQRAEDRTRAVAASDSSLAIRRALVARDPARDAWRWDLVESLQLAGDLEREKSRPEAARAYYSEASDHLSRLIEKGISDFRHAITASQVLVRLGDLDMARRDHPAAKARYVRAFESSAMAVRASQGELPVELRRELGWNFNKLGDIEVRLDQHAAALVHYEKGLCVRQALSAAVPDQTEWRRDLSWTFEKMAAAYAAVGDFKKALPSQFGSLAIRRRLVAIDSTRLIWARDLGSTLHQIAELYLRDGDPSSAIAFYLAAADARKGLQKRTPTDAAVAAGIRESMEGAARARQKLLERGPLAPERLWREVVSEEEQNAAARALQSNQDPQTCWNAIVAELRAPSGANAFQARASLRR
jgi:tetratricopeptide (TPR) repeat protein